jgi:hypothetical protein
MMRTTRFVACAALLTFAMVVSSDRARAKEANTFQVLTGFSSKETCSCVFVVEQTDEYCTAFGQAEGYDVRITIDRSAKTVTSAFGTATRTARMKDGEGCNTDPLP